MPGFLQVVSWFSGGGRGWGGGGGGGGSWVFSWLSGGVSICSKFRSEGFDVWVITQATQLPDLFAPRRSDPFHPMVRIAITALDMAVDLCLGYMDARSRCLMGKAPFCVWVAGKSNGKPPFKGVL